MFKFAGWFLAFGIGLGLLGPSQAQPALEVYSRLPVMSSVTLAPSGTRYAFVGIERAERKVMVRSAEGRGIASVPIGDSKVRALEWAGDRILLISVTSTVSPSYNAGLKSELLNVLSFDVETGKQFWILADGARSTGVLGQYGLFRLNDRWWGAFAASPITRSRLGDSFDYSTPDLFRVDLETGAAVRIASGSERGDTSRDWLVDGSGKPFVQIDYIHTSGTWRITSLDSEKVLASGVDLLGQSWLISQGRTKGTFVYQKREADGFTHLIEASSGGGGEQVILEDISVERFLIDPVGGLLRGYDPAEALTRSTAFDQQTSQRIAAVGKAFQNQSLRLVSWSEDLSRMIFHASGGTESGVWWLIDVKANKAEELGWDYPEIGPDLIGPTRIVKWTASDGLEISGVLTLPVGREAKALPVVVMPHGGPASRDTLDFDWMAQAFASRGYAVLQPNFRGSTGFGQAFELAGHGEWGGKMQTDVSEGLASLASLGVADAKRACIVGGSYGGYVALAAVTLQQGLYRCAVSYAGVADLQALWKLDARRYGDGSSAGGRNFLTSIGSGADLKARSPITYASRADAPVLLVHGEDDTIVDFEQSLMMEKALKGAGKSVQLVRLPGEDHWTSRARTRAALLTAAVNFVEASNPPR